jgi:hypothetical protein
MCRRASITVATANRNGVRSGYVTGVLSALRLRFH